MSGELFDVESGGGTGFGARGGRRNPSNRLKRAIKTLPWDTIPFLGMDRSLWGQSVWNWLRKPRYHFSDTMDVLNCSLTPAVLIFFSVLLSAKIIGFSNGNPMVCIKPAEMSSPSEIDHALEICQTKNLYYVPPEDGIPANTTARRSFELGYYHWVPITLILQAILFYLPNRLWTHLNRSAKADFIAIIRDTYDAYIGKTNEDEAEVNRLVKMIKGSVINRFPERSFFWHIRRGTGAGLGVTILYIFIKCLYLMNVVGQFFFLNILLGRSYRFWGYNVLKALVNGENWQDSPIFPQQALCDVPIWRIGNVHFFTLQCHLRINTYNEKVYFFIWWYFLLLAASTTLNLLYYLGFFLPFRRERMVSSLLAAQFENHVNSEDNDVMRQISDFSVKILRYDGVLLFWFIKHHAGPEVAERLITPIFQTFLDDEKKKEKTNNQTNTSENELSKNTNGQQFQSSDNQTLNRRAQNMANSNKDETSTPTLNVEY